MAGARWLRRWGSELAQLTPPVITASGSASGTACANCTVAVYSDDADEGRVYHGSVVADGSGGVQIDDVTEFASRFGNMC